MKTITSRNRFGDKRLGNRSRGILYKVVKHGKNGVWEEKIYKNRLKTGDFH